MLKLLAASTTVSPHLLRRVWQAGLFETLQTSEFGNLVKFGGTNRNVTSVTVRMVTWSYQSLYPNYGNANGWTWPITLNLYNVNTSNPNFPGSLIGTVTPPQPFAIPWRPEPSPECSGTTYWLAIDGCHGGMAFNITFDISSLVSTLPGHVLPDPVIFGISFNTQGVGYPLHPPTMMDGPYNNLNVGVNGNNTNTVPEASNPLPGQPYVNSTFPGAFADGGAGGLGVFRLDVGRRRPQHRHPVKRSRPASSGHHCDGRGNTGGDGEVLRSGPRCRPK